MRQILGAEECGRRRTSVRRRPIDESNDVDGAFKAVFYAEKNYSCRHGLFLRASRNA